MQIFKYIQILKNLRTNIWIYSVVKKSANKYTNIQIYKYIHTGEMAKIQIIFEGYFIWIFEYLNICAHHWSMPLGQSRQSGQSRHLGKYRQSVQYMHQGIL